MKVRLGLLSSLVVACLSMQTSYAFTNLVGYINSGGGLSSNLTHQSTGNIGLFPDAVRSKSDSHWVRAGVLVSFLLHPDLDFDGDGIPDEDDWDDDNDLLSDSDELTGVAFIPVTASDPFDSDSDDDGASDGDESVAGTNPTDASSLFRITNIQKENESVVVMWKGREGISYDLAIVDSLKSNDFTVVANIVAPAGTGVWHEVEVSVTNVPSSLQLFYRINVHK